MAKASPLPSVTVFIPTFNGEDYVRRVLEGIRAQDYDGDVDVLVIDSGSRDRTVAIVREFPEVRLHQIPNSEFGHGRTRNLAAQMATGEIVAYLTQDAIPANPMWLRELVDPFLRFPEVAGVTGKQVPRANCYPLLKREIYQVFSGLGPDFGTTVYFRSDAMTDPGLNGAAAFYSDVNSAARRAVLVGDIPYRDVDYAEDQLFGKDVLDHGLAKAYAPRAVVEHSNDLTRAELAARTFDEVVGLRKLGIGPGPLDERSRRRLTIRDTIHGWRDTLRDRQYSKLQKLSWLVRNPQYVATKWRSYAESTTVDLADLDIHAQRSLEAGRRLGTGSEVVDLDTQRELTE